MYKTDKTIDTFNVEDLKKIISLHKKNLSRYKMLKDYYLGKIKGDTISPYPKYITDMHVGYLVGNGVSYSCENENIMSKLNEIFYNSNEVEENYEIARICSIKGKAYEIVYIDEESNLRFNEIEPEECFLICDNSFKENVLFGVRLFDKFIEVYEKESVKTYDKDFKLIDEKPNYFLEVPIIEYLNNKDEQGDFEQVIGLIDAYNKVQNETLQDMTDFTDAYLKLIDLGGTNQEDIEQMKKDKVLLLNNGGNADWLIKNVNDVWVENFKNRLKSDIHKFAFVPDMSDEQFGSNLSGVSIRYKLLAMEQLRLNKERKFEMALQKRLRLIFKFLNITQNILNEKVKITFNSTLPQNIPELANVINSLSSFVSEETLLNLLPFIDNADEEIKKRNKENELRLNDYEESFNESKHD